MKRMRSSDDAYRRVRICDKTMPATTVSFSWLEYMALLRRAGNDVKAFSLLVCTTALHLQAVGHAGKLSEAVRKDVRGQLGAKA